MVALLLTAVAIMPVFGAVTGTVAVSKSYIAPSGTVTITVKDADLNVLVPATSTQMTTWATAGTVLFLDLPDSNNRGGSQFGDGTTTAGDRISGLPIVASVGGSTLLANTGKLAITVFNVATGKIAVTSNVAITPDVDVIYTYNLAKVNATTAKVTSPSSSSGITVALTETGADTGTFTGSFEVSAYESNDAEDNILAVAGQDITVKYTDASPALAIQTTVRVEATKPTGVLISPANGSNTTTITPKLTVDFTDADSTVDNGTFAFTIVAATANSDAAKTVTVGTATVTAITGGYRASATLAVPSGALTTRITWYASVNDKAGNVGRTDSSSTVTGDQDYVLIVDKQAPTFPGSAGLKVGTWWDATATTPAVETKATKSSNTIIGIQLPMALDLADTAFDVPEVLNAASITTADFEISSFKALGATKASSTKFAPTAVNVYAGAPAWIFLTVPAMAPDNKPTITLKTTAAGISDAAGNQTSAVSGPTVATDVQAPTITAVLSNALHKTDSTLTITTNEAGAVPVVTVTSASSIGTDVAQTVTLTGTNTYQSKITPGFGMHTVKVVVADAAANASTLGGNNITSSWPSTGALAFYTDNALPAPTVTANNISASGASVEASEPFFITTAYSGEAKEYGLTDGGTVSNSTVDAISTDLDIHNKVTIATATLDGVDILALLDTQDNVTFNFAVSDISIGKHELVIAGSDEAGNKHDTGKISFTVTARKAYSVAMNSGWNLVSFPGAPIDGAIASVLPATHTATDVLSFDDGVWSVASRTAGGVWEGTLTALDGSHGYWINTSSSQPVKSLLALTSVGSASTLPTITVEAGWNLVSVIDLAQAKQSAAAKSTGVSYFTSLNWSVAYSYSASTRAWTRIVPTGGDVYNGTGVWVWATKAGTLIP
jgi:hypothetical protein